MGGRGGLLEEEGGRMVVAVYDELAACDGEVRECDGLVLTD